MAWRRLWNRSGSRRIRIVASLAAVWRRRFGRSRDCWIAEPRKQSLGLTRFDCVADRRRPHRRDDDGDGPGRFPAAVVAAVNPAGWWRSPAARRRYCRSAGLAIARGRLARWDWNCLPWTLCWKIARQASFARAWRNPAGLASGCRFAGPAELLELILNLLKFSLAVLWVWRRT
jgi:hypothetical protein